MRKITLQPGDSGLVIDSGFTAWIVRVLIKILFRYPWEFIYNHALKIYEGEITIEADVKGVKFYNINKYRKAKKVVIFRHKFYKDEIKIEQYKQICQKIVDKKMPYGYVNYFRWYLGVGVAYFPFMFILSLAFGISWLFSVGILTGFIALYFVLSKIFKRLQKKSSHCSELAARIDQEYMGVNLGILDYEHVYPNYLHSIYSVSWKKIVEFLPAKGEWPIKESNSLNAMLASGKVLGKKWDSPKEDKTWKNL